MKIWIWHAIFTSHGEHVQVLLFNLEAKYAVISQTIASVIQFSCFGNEFAVCECVISTHSTHHLLFSLIDALHKGIWSSINLNFYCSLITQTLLSVLLPCNNPLGSDLHEKLFHFRNVAVNLRFKQSKTKYC